MQLEELKDKIESMNSDLNGPRPADDVSSHMGSRMHKAEGAIEQLKNMAAQQGKDAVQNKINSLGMFMGGTVARSTEYKPSGNVNEIPTPLAHVLNDGPMNAAVLNDGPMNAAVPNDGLLDADDRSLLKAAIASAISNE